MAQTVEETVAEEAHMELSRQYLEYFVDYVYILEPPPGRGKIKFEKWPHLVEAINVLTTEQLIVWLKSRQIGASWLIAAHFLRCAQFEPGAQLLMFSQGEEECKQLLWKSKFIYQALPPQLQVKVKSLDNQQELAFPSIDSWIRALPSTQKSGRSYTATKAVFDEADFHPHLEENVTAVEPTLNDNGGQLILTSTSNGDNADSLFKRRYRAARKPT
jgi:phage terminase large subunit-like protein